jgi:hypothetical protein
VPLVGAIVVVSIPIVVDLPAPVRAQEPEHLNRGDVEVDPLHRLDTAPVGLLERTDRDRRRGATVHVGCHLERLLVAVARR